MYKGFKILILIFSMILLVNTVSAWEFDNVIDYYEDDMIANFTNAFGLGANIGSVKLKSHKSVNEVRRVEYGNQVVMYYDFNFKDIYEEGLGEVEFKDMKTNQTVERDYEYVYAVYEDILTWENDSQQWDEVKTLIEWLPLNNLDIPKRKITIGIRINVTAFEHTDAVFNIVGKKVKRHAQWDSLGISQDLTGTCADDMKGASFNGSSFLVMCSDAANDMFIVLNHEDISDFYSIAIPSNENEHPGIASGLNASGDMNVWYTVGGAVDELRELDGSGRQLQTFNLAAGECGGEPHGVTYMVNETDVPLLYVADFDDNEVCVYDLDGVFQSKWAVAGSLNNANSPGNNGTHLYISELSANDIEIYLPDGTFLNNQVPSANTRSSGFATNLSITPTGQESTFLVVDEDFGVRLYVGSLGVPVVDSTPPNVINNTPENITYGTISIPFNVTTSDASSEVQACWYSLNSGVFNYSLTNVTSNEWTDTNASMTEGGHKVNFYCNDTLNNVNNSESVSFNIFLDIINPEINITFPENITYNTLVTRINITYNELNPDKCWYSNNSGVINSSGVSCNDNFTDLTYGQGSFIINTYINDTAGNQNFSTPITFFVDSINPEINITFPTNYTNSSNLNLDVNYTYIENNPSSCWWSEDRGVTNTTLTNCGTNITGETWDEGGNTVIIYINDSSNSVNSSSVFFTIDSIITNVSIRKLGNVQYHVKDTNLTINWTATDPLIDTCIFEYSGVNTTLPCARNYTEINITSNVNKTVILWVNDTLGNVNTSSMTWDYYIFQHELNFNNETLAGSLETFTLNITKQAALTISAINLNYNNTNNLAVFTGTNNIFATVDQTIPFVSNTTDINFLWEILLSNSTILRSFNNTQQVKNISVDDCTAFSTLIYNYTLFDEEEQTLLSGDELNVEIDLKIFSLDRTLTVLNFSSEINGTNPVQICTSLPLNTTSYLADTVLKYTNLNYAIEYYNIVNFTLSNETIPQNINLFDLNISDSTEFQLTFTGSDFLPVENALVFVNRQYIAESVFKTVELPKTDSNGQTILHLVRNDVIYNIIIIKDGVILGTFENLIAFCEDFSIGACTINLNALSSVEEIYDVDEDLGIVFTIPTYNETSRIISFSFVSDDGTSKIVLMDVTRNDVFGNRSVCNDTLISSAGTLSCTVGANIEDSTLRNTIYVNGEEVTVTTTKIDKSNFGAAGYLVFFVMAISFILLFSVSKTGVLFGIGLSFLAAIGLGLITGSVIGLGAAGLWLILILVLAIWKLNKERIQ